MCVCVCVCVCVFNSAAVRTRANPPGPKKIPRAAPLVTAAAKCFQEWVLALCNDIAINVRVLCTINVRVLCSPLRWANSSESARHRTDELGRQGRRRRVPAPHKLQSCAICIPMLSQAMVRCSPLSPGVSTRGVSRAACSDTSYLARANAEKCETTDRRHVRGVGRRRYPDRRPPRRAASRASLRRRRHPKAC